MAWDDKVKGRIEISNDELDDLVIARPDGTPTYNFCVVVDDIDMSITHVIRGDDHVNNTPRQINIFRALGKEPPVYAHLPTVLNEQGEKMSKRNGAKPVTQYRDEGFLADAMVNYLARLGWSHGDDEIFSREQFVQWFNLDHLGRSAAQFDEAKLRWVNAQHLKAMADEALAQLVAQQLQKRGIAADDRLPAHLRAVQGPLRHDGGAGRLGRQVLSRRCSPTRRKSAKHVVEGVRPADRHAGAHARGLPVGEGRDHRGDQGSAARHGHEDAATGDAGARAGDGNGANSVAGCGAGTVRSRDCARAAEGGSEKSGYNSRLGN